MTGSLKMGLFGPSAFEEAVFRQMDQFMSRSATLYDEAMLRIKEQKLDTVKLSDDPKTRRAQKNWVADARASVAYRRHQITRETEVRSISD